MQKLSSIVIAVALLTACAVTREAKTVSYTEAHGYFVRNDAPPHAPYYYDSQAAFDSVFGCAAVMGPNGMPTAIDFSRQSVVAVMGAETNRPTEYRPLSLTSQADTLRLTYTAIEQSPTSYTMLPLLLIVIDKPNKAPTVRIVKQ